MKTQEFNLQNWTGETATIEYTTNGKFEMYDYGWEISDFVDCYKGEGYRKLICRSDKNIEATLLLENADMETAVISAARWIANHI